MKFYINSQIGSGMKYNTKEDFMKEISLMIDDCMANGGTFFSVDYEADASCFYIPEGEEDLYSDNEESEE